MSKYKVFNDPIYGLVNFPFEIIYELIDHRYFQRLRRICQVGLSSLVYPGAVHTRFHHALGVTHLASELIINLRQKGVDITDEEYEATCIAALLHDIGHAPYSHALEFQLLPVHHEVITLALMNMMNHEFDSRLDLALKIFQNQYHKTYLYQMLSSQLDVDRMDYLNRDSYYTGVAEGIIGYDRIIKMMNVEDNQLVIEEKGLFSVEKFLLSRYMMYRQVYLHKTAIGAEHMLKLLFTTYKQVVLQGDKGSHPTIDHLIHSADEQITPEMIENFVRLDDTDIMFVVKQAINSDNKTLAFLANGILNRRLFKTVLKKENFSRDFVNTLRLKAVNTMKLDQEMAKNMVSIGRADNTIYKKENEILIKTNNSNYLVPFSKLSQIEFIQHNDIVNYLTFPKGLL